MQTAEIQTGRRVVVVLEPGDEILTSLAEACRHHGIAQATISTFSGAFRTVRLIAAETPAADPEAPMPSSVDVPYTEGLGSGTITTASDGALVVHVHVAVGVKDDAARAYAGHLLSGETHYVVEVVLDEILSPALERRPHPGSAGLPILQIPVATAP